jgi:hypothetical protein
MNKDLCMIKTVFVCTLLKVTLRLLTDISVHPCYALVHKLAWFCK